MDDNRRRPVRRSVQSASADEVRAYSRYSRQGGDNADSAESQASYSRYSRASMGERATSLPRAYNSNSARPSVSGSHSRDQYARVASARKKKNRKKVIMGVVAAAVALVLVGAVSAFAYLQSIQKNLHDGVDSKVLAALENSTYTGDPFYMLLMGTDKSAQREETGETDGIYRSDSMMVARIDPKNVKITLISLQRDTLVNMGAYGQQKLNAAYVFGGPAYTIEVVEGLCGVNMSHYAEIGFDGFCSVVDAVGGIEVDVPIEIDDDDAGGHLDAGFQTINGDQALILCRSRHAYDNIGKGDEYRAANQRMVLSAIAKKVLQSDLPTLIKVVSEMSKFVTTDLSLNDILTIAAAMRGLDPSTDIYSAMTPTDSVYDGEMWYEKLRVDEWKTMMQRVDSGLPPTEETTIDPLSGTILSNNGDGSTADKYDGSSAAASSEPSGGKVVIRNGSNIAGAAAAAAERLEPLGYTTETGNAELSNYQSTLVIYQSSSKADEAASILSTLGVGHTVKNDGSYTMPEGASFMIVIGADFR